ncbi:MAG: transcription termination/antitermination protein NusA [Anaerolineales bacterium]|nr:transcription termination/antitermination protein NusA [Anaerolineales bacterium]
MKSEFTLAFNEIIERSALSQDMVLEALEAAMVSAYRRAVSISSAQKVEARIDMNEATIQIFTEKEVVEDVQNPLTETLMATAREIDPDVELGETIMVDSTPEDFGRVAAQTAKQVILQRLREAERDAQYLEYVDREGDMVHGTVHSVTSQAVTIGLGRAEAILPRNQQIPGERFHVRDRVRVYVLEVRKSSRGPIIIVSRTHPAMLRRLLEMEVPEINQGLVEIKAISREAGKRAKVAVAAIRDGIDPVGACVGLRGVRIQSIVRDLNDEKIDVIEWNPDVALFISKALSPARVSGVYLDDDPSRGKTAMVVVPEDQLSLAIGRSGVNARLAARLTSWRIDIKSLPEAAMESLHLYENHPVFTDPDLQTPELVAQIREVLDRKAENRPITPEEYQSLNAFVERIQRYLERERGVIRREEREKVEEARAEIPEAVSQVPLEDIGLPERVLNLLLEAGYGQVARLWEDLLVDEDRILGIAGIGPKAMEDLKQAFEVLKSKYYVEPEPEPEVVEEVEAAEEAADVIEAAAEEEILTEAEMEVTEAAEEILAEAEVKAGEEAKETEPEIAVKEDLEFATIQEVFEKQPEIFDPVSVDDFDDETGDEFDQQKKKKRKKGQRIVEFDPDLGKTIVKKRRKPGRSDDWGDINY